MNKNQLAIYTGKFLFLIWFTLCVATFIFVPGRVSYIHWVNLANFSSISSKLARIDAGVYAFDLIRAILGIGIFSLASASLGLFLLNRLKLGNEERSRSTLSRLAFLGTAFLMGHGIFSLIFLVLASNYRLTPSSTIIVLSIGLVSGLGTLKNALTQWTKIEKDNDSPSDMWQKMTIGLLNCILLASLLYSSARLSYDSTAVYFSDAKLTAMTNRIQYFTDDSFVVSIFHTAIQFTALIQAFGDQAARLFSWACGLIIIIFSLAVGEEIGLNKTARLVLLSMLISSTSLLDLMGDGKVDLASSAPAVAAVYWLLIERRGIMPRRSMLILIGFFSSLAMIARPFNIILMGGFMALYYLLTTLFTREEAIPKIKRFVISLLWIGAGAAGMGFFHLAANWMILGDPLAMLFNAARVDSSKWQWAFDPDQILTLRLLYPLAVTFLNTPQSLGNVSLLFIAFLPALLAPKLRLNILLPKPAKILLFSSITILALWAYLFFTVMEIRYVLFLWIILFMPISQLASAVLTSADSSFRNLIFGAMTGLLLFIFLRTLFISIDSYSPVDRFGNPQCYDSRFCEYLRPINEIAPEGARVLTLSAFRYYLRSDLFACSTTHEDYLILQDLSNTDPDAFWREVYRQGYQFIAYENDYTTRHLQFGMIPSPENTPHWLTLQPIYGKPGDLQIAYQIHATMPPLNAEVGCEKTNQNVWEVQPIHQSK